MKVRLQARISGFSNKPSMIYALYDTELDTCIIGKIGDAKAKKQSGAVLISDTESSFIDDRYSEEDIAPSINDYFGLLRSDCLILKSNVQQASPQNAIDFDGVKNGKKEYSIMPTITNAQVGVLAIARHIQKSKKAEQSIEFIGDFFQLANNTAISI